MYIHIRLIVFSFCIGFIVGTVKYFALDDNQLAVFESDTKLAVRIFVRAHNDGVDINERRIYLNGIIRELINAHEEILNIFPYKYIVKKDDINRFKNQKKRFLELASIEEGEGVHE